MMYKVDKAYFRKCNLPALKHFWFSLSCLNSSMLHSSFVSPSSWSFISINKSINQINQSINLKAIKEKDITISLYILYLRQRTSLLYSTSGRRLLCCTLSVKKDFSAVINLRQETYLLYYTYGRRLPCCTLPVAGDFCTVICLSQ